MGTMATWAHWWEISSKNVSLYMSRIYRLNSWHFGILSIANRKLGPYYGSGAESPATFHWLGRGARISPRPCLTSEAIFFALSAIKTSLPIAENLNSVKVFLKGWPRSMLIAGRTKVKKHNLNCQVKWNTRWVLCVSRYTSYLRRRNRRWHPF